MDPHSERLLETMFRVRDARDIMKQASTVFKEKKVAKRNLKTFCGHCGEHRDKGTKLQTCSLCRFVKYLCVCVTKYSDMDDMIIFLRSIN